MTASIAPPSSAEMQLLRERSDAAWLERRRWDPVLNDIHTYVMPWLKQGVMPGSTDGLFDTTAVVSALRFGSRLQNDVLPPGQRFYDLAAGPLIRDERQRNGMNAALQEVAELTGAVLRSSNFEVASGELCMSLSQGTAAMLGMDSHDRQRLGWLTVPIQEIALREGPFSDVEGIYWRRKWRAIDVPRLFRVSDDKLPAMLGKMVRDPKLRQHMVEVRQDTEWDPDRKRWIMVAYTALDDGQAIVSRAYRKNRWITPRFLKMPGESMGRGPGMLALAPSKTLNKTMELLLKSAALALFGVYLWRDDSVFDPDTAHVRPGAMWKVASTGGVMGPPVTPLDATRNFDISQIVLADQREQVRMALYDESLPDMQGSVRTPTEIMERLKRSYRDHAAATGRLIRELAQPVVELTIDVMEERGQLPTKIDIDQLGVSLMLTSPLARAQALEDVQRLVEGVNIARAIGGEQEAAFYVENERVIPDALRKLGWRERDIVSADKRKQAKDAMGQMAGMAAAAEMAKGMPTPAGGGNVVPFAA